MENPILTGKYMNKSSANDGSEFEALVKRFYDCVKEHEKITVIQNAFLNGPDGPREIDILIESTVAGHKVKIIVECKDYNKNVDVKVIDALVSKMADVNASKAILIARKGFSKTAIMKARRHAIELCTIGEALSPKWKPQFEIGVVVTEDLPSMQPSFQIRIETKKEFLTNLVINVSLPEPI